MKRLTTTLYERNLLYQQLHFKYAALLYFYSISQKHGAKEGGRWWKIALTLLFFTIYLIDYIMGAIILFILVQNPALKAEIIERLSLYTSTVLEWSRQYITWLMGVPWGIKLNTPLNNFMGSRYLYILDLWKLFYSEFISLYITVFLNLLLFLLPLGVTVSITAMHDFLKFLNLCLICFFIISSRICTLQISAIKSLGRLFMGKKWNILRERVDSYNYDINQLLIGTIIFTILLFLLPTTGMYMLVFLYMRILQFAIQFILRVCAVFINRLTVKTIAILDSNLQDQAITKAKVFIDGLTPNEYAKRHVVSPYKVVDGKWCKLECFSINNDSIRIQWNGKMYTVQEMQEIVAAVPVQTVGNELEPLFRSSENVHRDLKDTNISNHSMMHWFWIGLKN